MLRLLPPARNVQLKILYIGGLLTASLFLANFNQPTADANLNSSTVSAELQFQRYLKDGSAEFRSKIKNSGPSTICLDERTLRGFSTEFRSKTHSALLFSHVDDVFSDETPGKTYTKSKLVELAPNQVIQFSFSVSPLKQPYYVDDTWDYLADYQYGETILAALNPILTSCSYPDLNSALEKKDFFQVRSNSVTMPKDEGKFFVVLQ